MANKMLNIKILGKTYKAKNEIIIKEGFIFLDGDKETEIPCCSFHPLEIISGKGRLNKSGGIIIK